MSDDTRDRVIALETDHKHLTLAVEALTSSVAKLAQDVEKLTTLLERARGALWVISIAAGLLGAIAAKVAAVIPWAMFAPR